MDKTLQSIIPKSFIGQSLVQYALLLAAAIASGFNLGGLTLMFMGILVYVHGQIMVQRTWDVAERLEISYKRACDATEEQNRLLTAALARLDRAMAMNSSAIDSELNKQ